MGGRSPRSQLPAAPDIWSKSYPAVAAEPGLPACGERPQWGWLVELTALRASTNAWRSWPSWREGWMGEGEIEGRWMTDCSRTSISAGRNLSCIGGETEVLRMKRLFGITQGSTPGLCCCSHLEQRVNGSGWLLVSCLGLSGLSQDHRNISLSSGSPSAGRNRIIPTPPARTCGTFALGHRI